MAKLNFRPLRADEIDVRVGTVSKAGVTLLLYKDARCDQNVLDETVGPFNWQRHHSRDNANCVVAIWDEEKSQWIEKEDTGTESNTEKEKGLASDSFKRACFNWGIGRELYTAPFIFVKCETEQDGRQYKLTPDGKKKLNGIKVDEIEYTDGRITRLAISNRDGIVYNYGKKKPEKPAAPAPEIPDYQEPREHPNAEQVYQMIRLATSAGMTAKKLEVAYQVDSLGELTMAQYEQAMKRLRQLTEKRKEPKDDGRQMQMPVMEGEA